MIQYSNFDRKMETRNHLTNEKMLKILAKGINIRISILLISFIAFNLSVNAQINLEHTFDGLVTHYGSGGLIGNNTGVNLYGYTKNSSNQVLFYNEDYSLYKTITITPPTGYNNSSISFVSKNLFNSDDKIEFIIAFINPNALQQGGDYNTYYSSKIYNEDGNLIKDFGTSYQIIPSGIVNISNGQFKLLIHRYVYNTNSIIITSTEIYSLPGTLPNSISEQSNTQFHLPYPNPANTTITLPYQLKHGEISKMNIYNINGQLIETKHIGYNFDKILLNVSTYIKGVYIYEVNGISNRFIVE